MGITRAHHADDQEELWCNSSFVSFDTELDCIQSLLRDCCECSSDPALARKVQILKSRSCLYIRRGYWKLGCVSWINLIGFDVLGTESHTKRSAILKTDKSYSGDRYIAVAKEGM